MKNLDKNDSSAVLSDHAEMLDQFDIQNDVAVSRWRIDKRRVNYQKNDSHTLSMYVVGGETSYRVDRMAKKGAPGKLCLMPQGHEFDWQINGVIEFIHLYFTDKLLKQYAARHFDIDVRFVSLQDLTYKRDDQLRKLLAAYFSICESRGSDVPLFAEQTLYSIFDHLITLYNTVHIKGRHIQGGLSPYHRHQIKSAITEGLDEKLSIARLADLVGLSPFHFARMFKLSFGETPAQYITRTRIEWVKGLLKTSSPLAEISVAAGFSQQSHMTHHFKRMTGLTPQTYRSLQ